MTDVARFRSLLMAHHDWPTMYKFKFVVPTAQADAVKALFNPGSTTSRFSAEGNYVSLSASVLMPTPDAVIEVYQQAEKIEGLIAL